MMYSTRRYTGSEKIVSNCARLNSWGDLSSQMLHIAQLVLQRRLTLTCSTVGAITLKCLVTWFSYKSRATDGISLITCPDCHCHGYPLRRGLQARRLGVSAGAAFFNSLVKPGYQVRPRKFIAQSTEIHRRPRADARR